MKQVIWEIPGGRMNIDEEPRKAVAREIQEELGIDVTVGGVVYMEQFIQGNEGKRAFVIVYACTMVDSEQPIHMSETEVCEIAWVSYEELPKYPLFPEYLRALNCYFANGEE